MFISVFCQLRYSLFKWTWSRLKLLFWELVYRSFILFSPHKAISISPSWKCACVVSIWVILTVDVTPKESTGRKECECVTEWVSERKIVFGTASALPAGQTMIDGQLWLFKKCHFNLTIHHLAHSLNLQNVAVLRRICCRRRRKHQTYTAAWACPVYDLPCRFVQYNQFDTAPPCPFSAPHENLHALPGWENP